MVIMTEFALYAYVFIFGLCIGSFLNVCIYRLPEGKSFAMSRSECPACGNMIRFYDNIPVLSYLILRGHCRHCKVSISVRYVFVELITGFCAICTFVKFGLTLEGLIYFIFIAALIVVIFIDIDHKIIPDIITKPGIPICFIASFALASMTMKASIIGILAGGGSLFLVAWVYKLITKREGMGRGDIKLLAMIGALIGWKGVLFTIYAASVAGTLVGIPVILLNKKNFRFAIPFGPFLSVGAIAYIFYGEIVIRWYLY
ncbi:MAG: prepilin peptidase [Deltaproteobacteria bacterium]|nr:prepilin peptidase [Deltaproteobacteria bacterium]